MDVGAQGRKKGRQVPSCLEPHLGHLSLTPR